MLSCRQCVELTRVKKPKANLRHACSKKDVDIEQKLHTRTASHSSGAEARLRISPKISPELDNEPSQSSLAAFSYAHAFLLGWCRRPSNPSIDRSSSRSGQ